MGTEQGTTPGHWKDSNAPRVGCAGKRVSSCDWLRLGGGRVLLLQAGLLNMSTVGLGPGRQRIQGVAQLERFLTLNVLPFWPTQRQCKGEVRHTPSFFAYFFVCYSIVVCMAACRLPVRSRPVACAWVFSHKWLHSFCYAFPPRPWFSIPCASLLQ